MDTTVSRHTTPPWVMAGDGEPAVFQEPYQGYNISWNPDDSRWYVEAGDIVVKTFKGNAKGWHNMRYWIRTSAPRR